MEVYRSKSLLRGIGTADVLLTRTYSRDEKVPSELHLDHISLFTTRQELSSGTRLVGILITHNIFLLAIAGRVTFMDLLLSKDDPVSFLDNKVNFVISSYISSRLEGM